MKEKTILRGKEISVGNRYGFVIGDNDYLVDMIVTKIEDNIISGYQYELDLDTGLNSLLNKTFVVVSEVTEVMDYIEPYYCFIWKNGRIDVDDRLPVTAIGLALRQSRSVLEEALNSISTISYNEEFGYWMRKGFASCKTDEDRFVSLDSVESEIREQLQFLEENKENE